MEGFRLISVQGVSAPGCRGPRRSHPQAEIGRSSRPLGRAPCSPGQCHPDKTTSPGARPRHLTPSGSCHSIESEISGSLARNGDSFAVTTPAVTSFSGTSTKSATARKMPAIDRGSSTRSPGLPTAEPAFRGDSDRSSIPRSSAYSEQPQQILDLDRILACVVRECKLAAHWEPRVNGPDRDSAPLEVVQQSDRLQKTFPFFGRGIPECR